MKRIISSLVALLMIFSIFSVSVVADTTADVWDGSIATEFAGGTGTEDDPYQIETAAQLAYFSDSFAGSNYPEFGDSYFVLTNDIDLNGLDWTPIGSYINPTNYFSGYFDGQGYTISNMYIQVDAVKQYDTVGLFGISEATIVNLNVQGEIIINCDASVAYYGGIVGLQCGDMDNCTSDVDITLNGTNYNYAYLGGITGDFQGGYTMSNCINYGDLTISNDASYGIIYVGGIAGDLYQSTIESCLSAGDITNENSYATIGGITGYAFNSNGDSSVISNSCSTGTITNDTAAKVGGIVGKISVSYKTDEEESYGVEIVDCMFVGSIEGSGENMGVIYSDMAVSNYGEYTPYNLYYASYSVPESAIENEGGTEIVAESAEEFFEELESQGVETIWAVNESGNVVVALADYTAVEEAIAAIPEDLSGYTDETVLAITEAVDAVIYDLVKAEQETVDAYAQAILDATSALEEIPVVEDDDDETESDLADTGANDNLFVWFSLMAISGIVLFRKKLVK